MEGSDDAEAAPGAPGEWARQGGGHQWEPGGIRRCSRACGGATTCYHMVDR